jgi:hypothetical protein
MSKGRKISITQDELNKKLAKGLIRGYKVMSSEKEKPKKKNKYGNQKVVVDGYKFDSKKEANRYFELKILQLAGEITDLKMQEPFLLEVEGKKVAKYIADFVYLRKGQNQFNRAILSNDGLLVVEDVKSSATRKLSTYRLKKKLMFAIHGITIVEK